MSKLVLQESEGLLSPFLRRRRYQISSKLIKANSSVLDIGCGSGGFKKYLKNSDYYGINAFKAWNGKQNKMFVQDIMFGVPNEIKYKKFDYIVALAFIEHIKKPELFFKIIKKNLKKNGRIIITTPHPIGRKIHDFGAKLGIFSVGASEEHEKFIELKMMKLLIKNTDLKLISYRKFLFGLNQVFVLG